ncbi:hypothetical protein AGMMS50249_0870 [candidate division SR1 bacterium]|nr:hypothetical protein AGMMS50249_0870 [candidate division SR1 bacterium]
MTMKIELKQISIRDVVNGYTENDDDVFGLDGKLNIRPSYQRNFVYKDKERNAVINTIMKDFPLNVMYRSKNSDGTFEMLDGQQRTISFCQYVQKDFSISGKYFHSLTDEEQNKFLDYKLSIYICEGTEREKLDWFEVINIAGKPLTKQELRNAIYHGPFVSDAKIKFSKRNCPAYGLAKDYLSGSCDRQDYLETAISWLSKGAIEEYMSSHQHNTDANELWLYFQKVINRVQTIFPNYRREMKGIDWGFLYNDYKDNTTNFEPQVAELMADDEVDSKSGIYKFLLDSEKRHLNLRSFSDTQKRICYEQQQGICPDCGGHFELEEMHADHKLPRSRGGKTTPENLQMLCRDCNLRKSDR